MDQELRALGPGQVGEGQGHLRVALGVAHHREGHGRPRRDRRLERAHGTLQEVARGVGGLDSVVVDPARLEALESHLVDAAGLALGLVLEAGRLLLGSKDPVAPGHARGGVARRLPHDRHARAGPELQVGAEHQLEGLRVRVPGRQRPQRAPVLEALRDPGLARAQVVERHAGDPPAEAVVLVLVGVGPQGHWSRRRVEQVPRLGPAGRVQLAVHEQAHLLAVIGRDHMVQAPGLEGSGTLEVGHAPVPVVRARARQPEGEDPVVVPHDPAGLRVAVVLHHAQHRAPRLGTLDRDPGLDRQVAAGQDPPHRAEIVGQHHPRRAVEVQGLELLQAYGAQAALDASRGSQAGLEMAPRDTLAREVPGGQGIRPVVGRERRGVSGQGGEGEDGPGAAHGCIPAAPPWRVKALSPARRSSPRWPAVSRGAWRG